MRCSTQMPDKYMTNFKAFADLSLTFLVHNEHAGIQDMSLIHPDNFLAT